METLTIGLSTLAAVLSANGSNELDVVNQKLRSFDSGAVAYLYQPWERALPDPSQVQASANWPQQVAAYAQLNATWSGLRSALGPLRRVDRAADLTTPNARLRMRPQLLQDAGNGLQLLWVYPGKDTLSNAAGQAILRVLSHHMDVLSSGASPLVVDVRRSKVHRPTRRRVKAGTDDYIAEKIDLIGRLWQRRQDEAA